MRTARVDPPWDFEAWRDQARAALGADVPPENLSWDEHGHPGLFEHAQPGAPALRRDAPRVPRAFVPLATRVLAHRDPGRLALLYRILWRLAHGEPRLLDDALDPDVQRATLLAKAVSRDCHKMKAFVRFRAIPGEADAFVSWFEPEHRILDLVAPFFARRFAGMRWAILTPCRSVSWDGASLLFGPGGRAADVPREDASEGMWRAYYANIFNPARLNPRMMRQEMPQKYWKNLPETHGLPGLLREAGARVRDMAERDAQPTRKPAMVARAGASDVMPAGQGDAIAVLRAAAAECRACPLWQAATRTVFGEGPGNARVVLVGEVPGDEEDLRGRPFVGPAGRLLDRALAELGVDRAGLYVTNAVKHFKFERRGKLRLHARPSPAEQRACLPWLQRELAEVRPALVACLGATAAQALLGPGFALMRQRGTWHDVHGMRVLATVHPSWVLRQRDPAAQEEAYGGLLADLARLRDAINALEHPPG